MRTFFILIFISIVGIGIALGTVYYGDLEKSGDNVALPSIKLPYKSFIAGTGVVEASSKNIYVGSPVSGVIKKVYVQGGEKIAKGELLFEIDDSAKSVKIPVLKAQIKASQARLQSAIHQLEIIKRMKKLSPHMLTNEKYTKTVDNFNEAKELFALSQEKLKALQKELKFYKIHAPINSLVLQSNVTQGSYFDTNSKALVLGSDKLNIKVNINEFDSWKFEPDSKAVAFIRGNPKQKIALKYQYTIPFVVPKKNLTGLSTEATDTRVLQVMYTVEKKPDFPLYIGEMLDVFVQTSKGK